MGACRPEGARARLALSRSTSAPKFFAVPSRDHDVLPGAQLLARRSMAKHSCRNGRPPPHSL